MPRRRVPVAAEAAKVRAARLRVVGGRRRRAKEADESCAEVEARPVGATELLDFAGRGGLRFLLQSYWKAYDFDGANLEMLLRTHEPPLVTSEAPGGRVTSLSWAYHQRDALGLTVFATVYTERLACTLGHLEAQLVRATEAGADAVMLMYDARLEPELHALGLAERAEERGGEGGGGGGAAGAESGGGRAPKLCLLFERSFG